MLSIAEMKELAQKDKELAKVKYEKDLAMYRDELNKVKPKFMNYIEKCIYNGIKHNKKIVLYKSHVEDIFSSTRNCGDNILYYLSDPTRTSYDAYNIALKDLADIVREELFSAGVKAIIKNENSLCMGEPYIILEV